MCVFIILKLLLIDKLVGHGDCTVRVIEMNFLFGNLERSRHVLQHNKQKQTRLYDSFFKTKHNMI